MIRLEDIIGASVLGILIILALKGAVGFFDSGEKSPKQESYTLTNEQNNGYL